MRDKVDEGGTEECGRVVGENIKSERGECCDDKLVGDAGLLKLKEFVGGSGGDARFASISIFPT